MAASTAGPDPAGAGGQWQMGAADRRERVLLWLRGLAGIGRALAARMSVVALQQSQDPATARVDLNLAWLLLARAMRWTRALRARLSADARAANVRAEPNMRMSDPPAANANVPAKAKAARQPEPDDGVGRIDGKPTAEIVEQICADLGTVGALLGITDAKLHLAEIAAQARGMPLGDRAQADWVQVSGPPLASGARDGELGERQEQTTPVAAAPAMPAAMPQLRAPDTG